MYYIFLCENSETFISQVMYLCSQQYFDNCMFRKGVTFLYAMTLIPV